ncbi:MAG: hypothetical protein ACTHXA_10725 [Gulosibacter sp.]|uniref:hypothetical protein n=1 Tax=Gulosibacter sp. TaxID=2817531 RepID=UPI003F93DA7A
MLLAITAFIDVPEGVPTVGVVKAFRDGLEELEKRESLIDPDVTVMKALHRVRVQITLAMDPPDDDLIESVLSDALEIGSSGEFVLVNDEDDELATNLQKPLHRRGALLTPA